MVTVPAQYDPLIREMSQSTGIPYNTIAAQANTESGFNATARSSAGALGWLQFLPSTYDSNATRAGVGPGTEFNPADEAKVYDVYMSGLLKQEGGSIRKALAAYNAGPGNLQAGYPYADKILGESGQAGNIITTGFGVPGLGGGLSISGILGNVMTDMRDTFERLGLILLGGALILLGIHLLSGGSNTTTNVTEQAAEVTAPAKGKQTTGGGTGKAATKTGATEAAEAAAVA
jgi:Transglycosylase SLT domain